MSSESPKVILYMSSVSGSLKIKNNIQQAVFLLEANQISFEQIDIAVDDEAKKKMHEASGKTTLPQVFVNDEFKGGFEEISESNEFGELKEFLGLA